MYKIYADDTVLLYDSLLEDYKLSAASLNLELDKSGTFSFAIYPEHFYYYKFIDLKTVITVYKFNDIIFRGRVLSQDIDIKKIKTLTCEGELNFLLDTVVRPYEFSVTPEVLLKQFIADHNGQVVDSFKKFEVGKVTVTDPSGKVLRTNTEYESTLNNIQSSLIESNLGGHIVITHRKKDPVPIINYLAEINNECSQIIKFGENLKTYTESSKSDTIATCLIPLGGLVDEKRVTIKSVNNGLDFIEDAKAIKIRGKIFKTMTWEDVTDPALLKKKAEEYLTTVSDQISSIEINAIDLHMIDPAYEEFKLGSMIRVIADPYNLDIKMQCKKITINLLRPDADVYTLGFVYSKFTDRQTKNISVESVKQNVNSIAANLSLKINNVESSVESVDSKINDIGESLAVRTLEVTPTSSTIFSNMSYITGSIIVINLYLQCDNEILNNNIVNILGKINHPPKADVLFTVYDDTSDSNLIGRITANGDICVNGKNLPGVRYLLINVSYCI